MAGLLDAGIGVTFQEDSDDDIEDDLPPCGKKGCHVNFFHEHVGKGQSTGGVEDFSQTYRGRFE